MNCSKCNTTIGQGHAHYIEITALAKSKGSSVRNKLPTGNHFCVSCVETKKGEMEGQLSIDDV